LYKSRCNLASTRGGDVTITPGATICDERFQSDAFLISNVGIKNQNTTGTCRGAALSKEEINMSFEQSADLPLKNHRNFRHVLPFRNSKTTLQTDQEP